MGAVKVEQLQGDEEFRWEFGIEELERIWKREIGEKVLKYYQKTAIR